MSLPDGKFSGPYTHDLAEGWEKRHTKLEEGIFKPVPDEVHSRHMVNVLLTLGVLAPFACCLIQSGLAYLYFRYGHPWAIILENEVFAPKKEHEDDETSGVPESNGEVEVIEMAVRGNCDAAKADNASPVIEDNSLNDFTTKELKQGIRRHSV